MMRGKSYLSLGSVSMGIAGSIVNQDFFESYLGMRVEVADMSEFTRRMEEGIYDPEEYQRALAWTKANCKEGSDHNSEDKQRTPPAERPGLGDSRENGPDWARYDDGEPQPGKDGF